MDLQRLRSLLAVADTGSITEAADRIGLTQPALSRRLQQLEAFFGAELLSRGRKGAQLTEIGRLVESEARGLVNRFDHLREQVRAHQGLEGGTVRIGGGATAVSFVLPKAIARFRQEHPGVRFQLKEAGSIEVAGDVISGRLELGLVTLPVQARELQIWPLITDRIVLVAPREHPLAHLGEIDAKALDGLAFVGFEADTAVRQIIDAALRDAGVEMNVVMELRSIPAILRMVATTGNLAFVSRMGVDTLAGVCEIEVRGLNIARELAVIAKQGSSLSPAAQAFSSLLREEQSIA
ncbi:MAG: LysR substrate-binding domain-containing protein [Candidatus Thiodiazotropha endolucinida]